MATLASNSRRTAFLLVAAFVLPVGLGACGGEEPVSQTTIDNVQLGENGVRSGLRDSTVSERQLDADADERAAEQARKRRAELAAFEKEQKAETDKILEEGVPGGNPEDSVFPIGSSDPEVERFRSRLAGVCDGAQQRITKITKRGDAAAKSKDPTKLLKVAQDYNDVLNDFMTTLDELDAPPGISSEYRDWKDTINALADNVRMQLVSQGNPKKVARLGREFQELSGQLLERSASLGVICLSTG